MNSSAAESRTLTHDGATIHYEVHGDGPPVLLLHGFSSSFRRNWWGPGWVRRLVEAGFRVIGPDFRGHGRSARLYAADDYLPARLCADIAAVQDAEGAAPADVIGFSMGAALALQFAMLYPERVARLVVGGVGDKSLPSDTPPTEPALIADALEAQSVATVASPLGRTFRNFAERGGNDLKALAAMMRGPGWPGRIDDLRPLPCPTLVVLAEKDTFMPSATRLRATLPDAEFVIVPETDHIGLSQDPRFQDLALDFLKEG